MLRGTSALNRFLTIFGTSNKRVKLDWMEGGTYFEKDSERADGYTGPVRGRPDLGIGASVATPDPRPLRYNFQTDTKMKFDALRGVR